MDKNLSKSIATAYIYHIGSNKVTRENIHIFRIAYPELNRYTDSEMEDVVMASIDDAYNEINTNVDLDLLYRCLPGVDSELLNFKRIAGKIRSKEFEDLIAIFPLSDSNKRKLLEAKHLLESNDILIKKGAEPISPMGAPIPPTPPEQAIPAPAPEIPIPAPVAEDNPISEEIGVEELDPKIKEKVILTVGDYLEKNIFQSKVTPTVTIETAAKLKGNGFVLKIALTSTDGETKAFAYMLFLNNKIQLPGEFFKEEKTGEEVKEIKLGDFIPEAIKDYFSYKEEETAPTGEEKGYNYLVSQLVSEGTLPVRRAKILDIILKKYGTDVAKQAFDVYTKVLFKHPEQPLVIENIRRINLREE